MRARARAWLGAVPLLGVTGLVCLAELNGAACGRAVATCESDCSLSDAPAGCLPACNAGQSACTTRGCSAEFQWYLTCIGNAESYDPGETECAEPIAALAKFGVGGGSYVPEGDGGTDGGGGSSSCANATCATVCSMQGGDVSQCTSDCETVHLKCPPGAQLAYQSFFSCLCSTGDLTGDAGAALEQCASEFVNLESACPALAASADAG